MGENGMRKVYHLYLFLARIIYLQVTSPEISNDTGLTVKTVTVKAMRGEIYDRNVTLPIVVNTDSFAIEIIPGEIPAEKYDTVALKLASMLGIDKTLIDKKVPASLRRSYSSIELKSNVTFEQVANIAENLNDLPDFSDYNPKNTLKILKFTVIT